MDPEQQRLLGPGTLFPTLTSCSIITETLAYVISYFFFTAPPARYRDIILGYVSSSLKNVFLHMAYNMHFMNIIDISTYYYYFLLIKRSDFLLMHSTDSGCFYL